MASLLIQQMSSKLKKKSNDFVVIEWSNNNCYTSFKNIKNAKLNDIVTCQLNDHSDAGRVIFIGICAILVPKF